VLYQNLIVNKFISSFILLLISYNSLAQCILPLSSITTTGDFQQINDIGVSVSSPTNAQTQRVNYESINGYYIGSNNTSEDILFILNNPVKQLRIVGRALSASLNSKEYFRLQINGQDYLIQPSQLITPDPIAGEKCFLQANGSILGDSLSVNNTVGDGSFIFTYISTAPDQDITSFEIEDSVASGAPEGAIFDVQISSDLNTSIQQQPSNVSICDSSAATFTIDAINPLGFQWQTNTDTGWANIADNSTYSGTITNKLYIKLATIAMNNYMYRCVVGAACDSIFSSSATLKVAQCKITFYVPSAFTPNNDGKNDYFKPILLDNVNEYYFGIYNRWGQLIFETNDINQGWNGMYNGVDQFLGTYVWVMIVTNANNMKEISKGTVVLIR
jgi:gliding motility-associated-like protein